VTNCRNHNRKIDEKPIDEVHLTIEEFFWIFALYNNEIQVITKIPSERQVAKFGEMTAKYMKELTNVLDTETRNELKLKM
jgi:hypothetical protein